MRTPGRIARIPAALLRGVHLACNGLERDAGHRLARELVELALLGGVGTAAQQLAHVVAGFARRVQGHNDLGRASFGVVTEREALLLATEIVLPEPAPRQVRRHLQVQVASIGEAHAVHVGRADRVAAGGVGQ